MQCASGHPHDEPQPGAIGDAVAAAMADGTSMDGIVARVRSWGSEEPPATEGRYAAGIAGLIGLQRAARRLGEEWKRAHDPATEGLGTLIAIESLRMLAVRALAEFSERAEPVPTKELVRLALALHRIESTDTLCRERERAAVEAGGAPRLAARPARMTHEERVECVRRALEGSGFLRGAAPPPDSGWDEGVPADTFVTPPDPAPDGPAGDRAPAATSCAHAGDAPGGAAQDDRDTHEAQDHGDARGAQYEVNAHGARDDRDARGARDTLDGDVARDARMRRRDAERAIWPTDPPFCPAAWSGPG
ncbi:MAG: hypothetical protein OXI57_06610 [Rhodospirillales bacterium]|nr:hypothetical protein [Rhodospirillales bacterium]